jgi:hypothetical protein
MFSRAVLTAAPVEVALRPVLARRAASGIGEAVCRLVARGVLRDLRRRARSRRIRGFCGFGRNRAGQGIGRLGASDRAPGGADKDLVQRVRALPVLRRHLHHDVILVARSVDHRNLALAEGIIERVVDLRRGDAEPGRRGTVDHQIGFEPLLLLVGVDVGQFRELLQRRGDLGHPFVELGEIVALQRVLVLSVALPATGADVLHRLQKEARAGYLRELAAQPADDPVDRQLALGERLQCDEHKAGIGLAATGEADDAGDRGILADDRDELGQLLPHQLKRDALVGLDPADHPAGVLLREEALRDEDEQIEVEADRHKQDQQDEPWDSQCLRQRSLVKNQHRLEYPLTGGIPARAPLSLVLWAMGGDVGAHHRRRGQGHRERYEDRHRQGRREFAEEAPYDPAHQEDWNEHRDQREAHREDGEADLAGAAQCRLAPRHPRFEVACDVFQDDDRVVDDEPGRDRQRHQRQIVEAVADQVHRAEGADQGHRDRDARDQGGTRAAQEREDDEDNEADRYNQRALDIVQ